MTRAPTSDPNDEIALFTAVRIRLGEKNKRHPASFLNGIPQASRLENVDSDSGTDMEVEPNKPSYGQDPDSSKRIGKRHNRSQSRGYSSLEDIYVHPASFQNSIIAASRLEDVDSDSGTDMEVEPNKPSYAQDPDSNTWQ